jgi:hypothetical protein
MSDRAKRPTRLEGFGTEEDRTTIKGIFPAAFLDGTYDQVTSLLRTGGV